jgi:hypothetical protein
MTAYRQLDGTADDILAALAGRHVATQQIAKYFAWAHLPERLKPISAPCAVLALEMIDTLPDGPELTAGLRKLLESKDCFVRAAL